MGVERFESSPGHYEADLEAGVYTPALLFALCISVPEKVTVVRFGNADRLQHRA